MQNNKTVLIAGAGPTGLATAIFLAEAKKSVRIVDKLSEPVGYSKAMALNPRSLELLESTGVTDTLLAAGREIRFIKLGSLKKPVADLDLNMLGRRYSHMVGIPQSETEKILEEKLNSLGIEVERETLLTGFNQTSKSVEVGLLKAGKKETFSAGYLVGADGARSNIRKQLGAQFEGETLKGDWHMADVRFSHDSEFTKTLSSNGLHVIFLDEGFLFAVSFKAGVYRIASNRSNVFDCLPNQDELEGIEWESKFTINHRLTTIYAKNRVALAGDAAHVHSPIGGRGMNLGIEDAFYLANAIRDGDLENYNESRLKAARGVIQLVGLQTNMALGEKLGFRLLRKYVLPTALSFRPIHKRIVMRFTGLNNAMD